MFQWKAKETHVVSIMAQWPLATVALVKDNKDDRLLPHSIRRQNRPIVRNNNPSQGQAMQTDGEKIAKKKSVVQVLASSRVSKLQV